MVSEAGSSKFRAILRGINCIIETDQLQPGDRLPSERELSERLQAGRSSIREVLRSLELLGLISTRRGEGTFIEPHYTHQLIDLLAGYILRDLKSCQDLLEMRMLLEVGAARLAVQRATAEEILDLERTTQAMKLLFQEGQDLMKEIEAFHLQIIQMAHNSLLTRIWHPVKRFAESLSHLQEQCKNDSIAEHNLEYYEQMMEAIKNREENQAASVMEKICLGMIGKLISP